MSKSIYPRILGVKKAKQAWEILKTEFQGSEKMIAIKLQCLWTDFDNLSMKEGESINDFFSRATEVFNQIKSLGENVPKKEIVGVNSQKPAEKFEHIVVVIEETKDLSSMTISQLKGSLEAHEKRVRKYSSSKLEQAFKAKVNLDEKPSSKGEHDQREESSQKRDAEDTILEEAEEEEEEIFNLNKDLVTLILTALFVRN